uniref:Uncharacterized protein n=1 Tax=Chlorobium chlorochromatii (strain CaD3) TaxID=340177 RepID=Q3AR29_CHLCH
MVFEISFHLFIISKLMKLTNYQNNQISIAMKKLFAFLFLLSSVSFVGCAKKAEEAPVEEPAAVEAPAAPAAEAPAAEAPAAPAAEAPAAEAPAAPAK